MSANRSASARTPQEPHNIDAERAVLGACLLDRDAIASVSSLIGEGDFFIHGHRLIYRAILSLWKRRQPADVVLVTDELRRTGDLEAVGYEPSVTELIVETPTAVHATYYAGVVADYAARRRFAGAGTDTVDAAYDGALDIGDVRARAMAALDAAARGVGPSGAESAADVMSRAHDAPDAWERRLMTTGIAPLDGLIGGFVPGQLVIVAARPGIGKSAFGLQVADHVARGGQGVALVSLEMSADDLGDRLVALHADVNMHRFRNQPSYYHAHLSAVTETRGAIADLPLRFMGGADGDVARVTDAARREMAARPYALLLVDYIGLMTAKSAGDGLTRAQELGAITRALKLLAAELGVVVMALAQLNRAIEQRRGGDAWPVLSDLRDSGAVEQDADCVVFLHRRDAGEIETRCDVAKHRNGPVGYVPLQFIAHRAMFATGRRP